MGIVIMMALTFAVVTAAMIYDTALAYSKLKDDMHRLGLTWNDLN